MFLECYIFTLPPQTAKPWGPNSYLHSVLGLQPKQWGFELYTLCLGQKLVRLRWFVLHSMALSTEDGGRAPKVAAMHGLIGFGVFFFFPTNPAPWPKNQNIYICMYTLELEEGGFYSNVQIVMAYIFHNTLYIHTLVEQNTLFSQNNSALLRAPLPR